MPTRIQRKRTRGSRLPEGAVYVGRPSKYGNPFKVGATIGCDSNETAVEMYRAWLERGDTAPYPRPGETRFLEALRETVLEEAPLDLRGKDLACWCCTSEPCHADVLLEYVNGGEG